MSDAKNRDVLAELDALKAEFEALKRAFLTDASEQKLRASDRGLVVAEAVEAAIEAFEARLAQDASPDGGDR